MAKGKEPRRVNMKTGSTLVILSIFFFFTASFANNIETASDQQIGLIKKGFFEPLTVLKSAAIIQGTGRYYVGLNFLAEGYDLPGIGIWLVEGDKHNPSKVYSVNATASLFSGYVAANQTQFTGSMADPKANMIVHFLKRK
jgi:hypothetical protein